MKAVEVMGIVGFRVFGVLPILEILLNDFVLFFFF